MKRDIKETKRTEHFFFALKKLINLIIFFAFQKKNPPPPPLLSLSLSLCVYTHYFGLLRLFITDSISLRISRNENGG